VARSDPPYVRLPGSALLLVMIGYGMSFDVEELRFAALDRDQTPASRDYLRNSAC